MLILAFAIVIAPLVWLVIKRLQHADPAARGTPVRWLIACLGVALALRVAVVAPILLRVALGLFAIGALVVWLRRRGQGGDGPGDDNRDPPDDPDPGPRPGHRALRPERLDTEAFDDARAGWEHGADEAGRKVPDTPPRTRSKLASRGDAG